MTNSDQPRRLQSQASRLYGSLLKGSVSQAKQTLSQQPVEGYMGDNEGHQGATAQQSPNDTQPQDPAQPGVPFFRAAAPEESAVLPGYMKPQPEELLLEWKAPIRPFKKHNRQFFTTVAMIVGLISLILFFAGQYLPVAVVIALGFLVYILNTIPPSDVIHQLTTYGIRSGDQLYFWEELGRFWFTSKHESHIVHIEVARFPNRLNLLLGGIAKDDMQAILSEILLYERPPLNFNEKAAQLLQEKLPLDLES